MTKRNHLGADISNVRLKLENEAFGFIDEKNIPHINWGDENEDRDGNGFDKHYRPCEGSEDYTFEYVLPKGSVICRYGYPGGYFTTDKGEPYEKLGLPYEKETIEYHEYEVLDNLRVEKGTVAPMFNSQGGAVQYLHRQSISKELRAGHLIERNV